MTCSWLSWNYIKLIIFVMSLLCLWIFKFISSSVALCLLIFGIVWFFCLRSHRKAIGKQDIVIISGCDTGLGFSLALHCQEHLNVQVIAGVHKIDSEGSKKLSEVGINVHPLDITDRESVKAFVQSVRCRLKDENLALRSVVNNAGTMIFGEFEWQTEDQTYHQVAVNLLGTMKLTKEFLPLLREYSSRLIVVTSHCASEPLPGVATYGATKAGLTAWATSLRVELKKYGVDVVNFVPGSFIRESNLVSQQKKHFEIMESEMTQEAKEFYSDYFKRYSDYLSPLSRNVHPQRVENPLLYNIFDDALLDERPQATYKCEPWRYMLYHSLFKITTTSIRDWLVEKFIQMPGWKEKK